MALNPLSYFNTVDQMSKCLDAILVITEGFNLLIRVSGLIKEELPILLGFQIDNSIPVITTELLAKLYGTEVIRIQQNHKRNDDRFVAGKHYFKVMGQDLKNLQLSLSESQNLRVTLSNLQISPKTRSLILWTQRGAARHAKMLDTDKAWDVFEALEDCYFNQKDTMTTSTKTTTDERTPLRDAVNMLVGKKGMMYPEAYSFIHQRFNITHIDQLPAERIPEAIEYVHKLVLDGEFIGKASYQHQLKHNSVMMSCVVFVGYGEMLLR